MEKHRTDQLQFIRLLALIPIVSWHMEMMGYWLLPLNHDARWNGANSSVVLFFILSGMISGYLSFDKDIRFSIKDSLQFVWKKIKKFYPLYLGVTLYSISFTPLLKLIADRGFGEDFRYLTGLLVRNLLLVQSWVRVYPGEYFVFSEVGWFMSTIMFLYLLDIPLKATVTAIRYRALDSGKKHADTYYLAAVIAGLLILITVYCFLLRSTDVEFTEYVLPIARIGEYMIGIALGYLLYPILNRDNTGRVIYNTALYTVLELASLVIWVAVLFTPVSIWEFRIVRWLIPNLLLLVVFMIGRGGLSRLFRLAPLKYLGDISFEIYLLHSMVIRSITRSNLLGETLDSKLGQAFTMLLSLTVTLMLAMFISRCRFKKGTS